MKKRITWIDTAKGIGTTLVILDHIKITDTFKYHVDPFHMPLFFFLSGYVFKSGVIFKDFLTNKIKKQLVPYLFLGLGIELFNCLYYSGSITSLVESYVHNILIQKRAYALWFFACLLCLNFIFYFIEKKIKNEKSLFTISLILACAGWLYSDYIYTGVKVPWNIDVCFTALPFFTCGFIFKNNQEKIDKLLVSVSREIIIMVILFFINILFNWLSMLTVGEQLDMFACRYGMPLFTYVSAFAGVFAICILAKLIDNKLLRYLGENSLLYYGWHQSIFIVLLQDVTNNLVSEYSNLNCYEQIKYKIVHIAIILVVTTVINEIIKHSKFKFVLGKQ